QAPAPTPASPEAPHGIQVEGGSEASLKDVLGTYHGKLAPALNWLHEVDVEFHKVVHPWVKEIHDEAEPYTQHLPLVVQEFLEDDGWFWVLLALMIVGLISIRSTYKRFKKATRRKQKRKKRMMKTVEIDLEEVSDAFSEPGANQVTVKAFPGRLRLVVM